MELYKTPSSNKKAFLSYMKNVCNVFCATHKNKTLIEDFNIILLNDKLNDFCEMNKFENLILRNYFVLQQTFYYNKNFMTSDVYERGISDHP